MLLRQKRFLCHLFSEIYCYELLPLLKVCCILKVKQIWNYNRQINYRNFRHHLSPTKYTTCTWQGIVFTLSKCAGNVFALWLPQYTISVYGPEFSKQELPRITQRIFDIFVDCSLFFSYARCLAIVGDDLLKHIFTWQQTSFSNQRRPF